MKADDEQAVRSGSVTFKDPLVAFLYTLLRDHLSFGEVEQLVRDAESHPQAKYTNGWVATYAKDLAGRLRKVAPSEEQTDPHGE